MKRNIEFQVGDRVTFFPYERRHAMVVVQVDVHHNDRMPDDRVFYGLSAPGREGAPTTICTGFCIEESELFVPHTLMESIAADFSKSIADYVGKENMEKIIAGNMQEGFHKDEPFCSSHDYCDPNQFMIDAMQRAGVNDDVNTDRFAFISQEAWGVAKEKGFSDAYNELVEAPGIG